MTQVVVCMLGNFASFFHCLLFFFHKKKSRNTTYWILKQCGSRSIPTFCQADLGPNRLLRLSADDQAVKREPTQEKSCHVRISNEDDNTVNVSEYNSNLLVNLELTLCLLLSSADKLCDYFGPRSVSITHQA